MISSNEEAGEKAYQLHELNATLKKLQDHKKEIEAELKQYVSDMGSEPTADKSIVLDGYVITLTNFKGRRTLDKDALIAAGVKVDDYMKTGAPYTTLKVTRAETAPA